jgi:retron-type reverse transcriptase
MSWQVFLRGKRKRKDVAEFSVHLMDNLLLLHTELKEKTYKHGGYNAFKINDPKPRDIHKASIEDRLLHQAIYRVLYPYFDRTFIYDSYSCRNDKGTHKAINRFRDLAGKVSLNHTRTVWVLKCDIRKFFANIDHQILKDILTRYIADTDVLRLLAQVIDSFYTENKEGVGLPLGNLTSQLLVNIYMNEFDQFVKRILKVRYYVRYADDFVILHDDESYLTDLIPKMSQYLHRQLKLTLHPTKVFIKTHYSGVDFLGWIHFPLYRVLRTASKRKMFKRLKYTRKNESFISYIGLLKHGNTHKLIQEIVKIKDNRSNFP